MRVGEVRAMAGPNVYSHNPVLILKLFLDDLTEKESVEINRFNERLLNLLPGIHDHHCAKG
jgi:cyanophycin synthetase